MRNLTTKIRFLTRNCQKIFTVNKYYFKPKDVMVKFQEIVLGSFANLQFVSKK